MTRDILTTAQTHDGRMAAFFADGWCKVFEVKECVTCDGKGGELEHDMQGAGVYSTHVEYFNPCSNCLDNGLCPGCGNKTMDPEQDIGDQTCVICDWEYSTDRFYPSDDDY